MAQTDEVKALKRAIAEKEAILRALNDDKDHPERYHKRIAVNNEKIAALQEENRLLASVHDNIDASISAVHRDIVQLHKDLKVASNEVVEQVVAVRDKLAALIATLTPEQLQALLAATKKD